VGVFGAVLSLARLITPPLMLMLALLILLGLVTALLLGSLMKRGDKILQGADKVGTEISLGFVGLLNGLGDVFNGSREALKRGMDPLQACGDAAEELHLLVLVGGTHGL
jgi:hypothetical protein